MKKIIFFFGLLTLASTLHSCGAEKVVVNREVNTTNDGKMLLGVQTLDQFQKAPYNDWYQTEYDEYSVDQPTLDQLKKEKLGSYQLMVFVGTWCEDSHRDFPRLMKILDQLKYNKEKLTVVALNRKKESPSGMEGKYNIHHVPTLIVSKYGKELGRIIEYPETGFLEKDLLKIIKKDNGGISDLFK